MSKEAKNQRYVVASVAYSRDRSINFSFYPISVLDYPEKAVENFNNVVLFDIREWIKGQMNKPDTALLGYEEMVIEWNGNKHLFHNL